MAMDGLLVLTCAALSLAPAQVSPHPTGKRSDGVADTLAVQTAMDRGRELLLKRRDARGAVQVLEAQLPRINGNREYLMLLRQAYRAYLKDLYLSNQGPEAKKYLERLCILDPDAAQDQTLRGGSLPAPQRAAPQARAAAAPKTEPTFRAKSEDPFDLNHENKAAQPLLGGDGNPASPGAGEKKNPAAAGAGKRQVAQDLVVRAVEEFGKRRFARARLLFEEAHKADERSTTAARAQWAYCKLHHVVEQLNQVDTDRIPWSELEREVRVALTLSPKLEETGQWLLREIKDRRTGRSAGADKDDQPLASVPVRHLPRNAQGWQVAETANFRILHNQSRELVNKAAQVAEQTRVAMQRKWFGKPGPDWQPRCDLYLHATGEQYNRLTGVPSNSPGHSRIESDGGRVISRRIDVHCDTAQMLAAVLPHETTHVVLAGQFGKHQVPRWADEGMAVLTEPSDKVELHRKNLARCRQNGQLFDVRDLMQLSEYPQPRRIGAFYAQSVSLVDFLTRERGAMVFSQFLRDALQDGYESALKKYYRYRDFSELQANWSRHAFSVSAKDTYSAGLRGRSR